MTDSWIDNYLFRIMTIMNTYHVIFYITSDRNAERYLRSEEGLTFRNFLIQKGIRYSQFISVDNVQTASKIKLSEAAHSASEIGLSETIDQACKCNASVLFVTDSREIIKTISGKEGCLPILLDDRSSTNLDNNDYIEATGLSFIKIFFDKQIPHYLFSLLKSRPMMYSAVIKQRNKIIFEQVNITGGVYIFGANTIGKQVYDECSSNAIHVLGFIDNDVNKQRQGYLQNTVHAPAELRPDRDVVILASGNYSYDIYQQLKNLNFLFIQNLSEFYFAVGNTLQPERYFHQDLWDNRIRYHALYLLLGDDKSRSVLDSLIRYRQEFDLVALAMICEQKHSQWFESEFFVPSDNHTFVDGGGYDGDTALRFILMNGNTYKSIHVFELDPYLAERAKANLQGYHNVSIYNVGLSSERKKQYFTQTGITNGRLSESDGVPTDIDSIDNLIEEKITFIKLDIEGAEASAIMGASRHIREDKPLIAIAVYHRAEDLWSIPRLLWKINLRYNVFLRHYTQVSFETVLYGRYR